MQVGQIPYFQAKLDEACKTSSNKYIGSLSAIPDGTAQCFVMVVEKAESREEEHWDLRFKSIKIKPAMDP